MLGRERVSYPHVFHQQMAIVEHFFWGNDVIPWIVKDIHHYWWLFVRTQHQTTQKTIVRKDSHNKKKHPMKKTQRVLESKLLLEKKSCRELRYWFKPSLTHHDQTIPAGTSRYCQCFGQSLLLRLEPWRVDPGWGGWNASHLLYRDSLRRPWNKYPRTFNPP